MTHGALTAGADTTAANTRAGRQNPYVAAEARRLAKGGTLE